jgi:uncharacterized membrane protein YhaH (DUF805 family)
MEWMLLPLRRYADFSGRSRRKEYWMYALMQALVYGFLILLIVAASYQWGNSNPLADDWRLPASIILLVVVYLAMLVPTLAVTVRRFHDQNLSGWFILLNFIPWVGGLVVFVFMCLPGTVGSNTYGDDPKEDEGFTGTARVYAAPEHVASALQGLNLSGFNESGHVMRHMIDPEHPALRGLGLKIGRGRSCDIWVDHAAVSRDHAEVVLIDGGYYLRDVGSTNGTFVNGKKLRPFEPCRIWPGDTLTFGSLELLLSVA